MGCSFLELFEPRHIRSMQHRRVCIVSLLKLLCFVLEMLLNECDLIRAPESFAITRITPPDSVILNTCTVLDISNGITLCAIWCMCSCRV